MVEPAQPWYACGARVVGANCNRDLDEVTTLSTSGIVEVAVGGAVIRCGVGTDAVYVAALARALRG